MPEYEIIKFINNETELFRSYINDMLITDDISKLFAIRRWIIKSINGIFIFSLKRIRQQNRLYKKRVKKITYPCQSMEKERGKNMNIRSNGKVMVLAKNSRESGDGRNRQTYYNLAILIDGEAGNISCSEDAYNKAVVGSINGVVYAYNEKYNSFRIIDIVPESSVPDYTQQVTSSDKPDPKADNPAKTK